MTIIELHNEDTAPEGTGAILSAVKQQLGYVPNLFRALANSPAALSGFVGLLDASESTTLSAGDRQIVQLAASVELQGGYCIAGHTAFSLGLGVNEDTVSAIRQNRTLPDARENALSEFSRELIRRHGRVSAVNCAKFLDAGFTQEQMLEVVLGIAAKTITNYAYGLFDFPLDSKFKYHAWTEDQRAKVA